MFMPGRRRSTETARTGSSCLTAALLSRQRLTDYLV